MAGVSATGRDPGPTRRTRTGATADGNLSHAEHVAGRPHPWGPFPFAGPGGCAAGLACVDGACVAPTGGGIGERCTDDSDCASGRCDFATESCREPLPAGGLCVKHSDCDTGYCDRPRDLAAGTCADRQAAGAACREGPMCIDGACVGGMCVVAICAATM